jgi:hypothetical protein
VGKRERENVYLLLPLPAVVAAVLGHDSNHDEASIRYFEDLFLFTAGEMPVLCILERRMIKYKVG